MAGFLVRALFLSLHTDTFLLCPHMMVGDGEGGKEREKKEAL